MVMVCLLVFCNGALEYALIALVVQAVIEKERRGDFLGKTVQVFYTIQITTLLVLIRTVVSSIIMGFYVPTLQQ
jgi:hypothetical protein